MTASVSAWRILLPSVVVALLCAAGARAQIVLPIPPTVAASGSPRTIVTGDLSGDGLPDVALTAPAAGRIRLLILGVSGEFVAGDLINVGGEPAGLFAADFDGDSDLDLAWTDARSGDVGLLLLQPGAPPTWQLVRRGGPDEPTDVVIADVDGDQRPDVVAAHRGADELVTYPNEGGVLGEGRPESVGDRPDVLALLQHPGGPTLALRQSGRLSRNVELTALADGRRTSIPLPGGGQIFAVDVEGDGVDELLLADEDRGELVVLHYQDDAWTETGRFEADAEVCGVAAATVAPGHRRLAVGSRGRRRVALYRVDAGSVVRESNWYSGGDMGDLHYEDIDADGAPDVFVAQAALQRLQVMPPLGDGVFAQRAPSAPAGGRSLATGSDLDGARLLAVAGADAGQVGVYRMAGPDPGNPLLLAAAPGVRAVRFAELDGQPGIDLASVSRTGGFRVHLANGTGGFSAAGGFVPTGEVADLTFVDVVGGPALDLVLARLDPPALVVHEGRGDGTFVASAAVEVGTNEPLVAVRTEDLDLDGRQDVVALGFDSLLTIFLNRAGEALAGVDLLVTNSPRDVGFGRFNADAYPDMVTINEGNSGFSVVTSLLPGVYTVAVRGTPSLPGASRLEVADFDLDGVDDLCVLTPSSRSVGVHLNTGTAAEPLTRFSPPVQFELCEGGADLAVLDLDADGRPDLVGLDGTADVLTVRLSDPFGSLARAGATVQVELLEGGRRIHVRSEVEYAHDLRLRRLPGNAVLALERSGPGAFEAFDAEPASGELVYLVENVLGVELDRAVVAPAAVTGVADRGGPVLLPVSYEPGRAVLRMRAPAGVQPELRIYDLRGRRVTRLELSPQGDGWFEGVWTGTDWRGRPVSRGRYLVRASLGPVVETGSVHLR